jgi:hypothetical protein
MYEVEIRSEIHKLMFSICNKREFSEERKESIILPLYKKGDKQIVVIIEAYQFYQLHTKFCQTAFFKCQCYLHLHVKLLGSSV